MISRTLAHFQIEERLGSGGMGAVYQAVDTKLNRSVAIKILPEMFGRDPRRLGRFQREARILASLSHPNVAVIHGLEKADDVQFLVLELVDGETLRDRLGRGALPVEEALDICLQIAEGVEAAHEKGVVHRDLKPSNVKITPAGTVKVLDFGLAKAVQQEMQETSILDSATLSDSITRAGVILGTPAYMSPEQVRGKPTDKRTDIWALGCILFECLTGQLLFGGDTVSDRMANVLHKEPDWGTLPARTPWNIRSLLKRCLQKDHQKRLRDIGDARLEIQAAIDRPESALWPSSPTSRRWRILPWALTGLLATAVLALLTIHLTETPIQSGTVRFALNPPQDLTLHPDGWSVISPDGRQLILSGSDDQGMRRLWLRNMDSLEVSQVKGTEGARFPFWSPDSRHIGFFAEGKLKTTAASGEGRVSTLADAPGAEGGTWNRDGVILFQPKTSGPLHRVSSSGGQSSAATTLDPSRRELGHEFPHFLPDGHRFLYLASSADPEKTGIYTGSLDSAEAHLLLNERSTVAYAPPGHLLFGRRSSLMAAPFDPDGSAEVGEAFPLSEDVGSWHFWSHFSVSNNGVLVYRSASHSNRLVWTDRSGRRIDSPGEPGQYYQLALSTDEERVVIDVGDGELWLYELSSGVFSRFTVHPGSDSDAVWSPDGRRLVFASDRNGRADLFQKTVGGGDEEALFESGEASLYPENWSPDGRFILFISQEGRAVYSLDLLQQERTPKLLLETPALKDEFRISPDNKWIAYNSNESGRWEVYTASFPDFLEKRQVSNAGGCQPSWRNDTKELLYLQMDGRMMSVTVESGATLETGVPRILFQTGIAVSPIWNQYSVTGDGQRFLMIEPEENKQINVVLNWAQELDRLASTQD